MCISVGICFCISAILLVVVDDDDVDDDDDDDKNYQLNYQLNWIGSRTMVGHQKVVGLNTMTMLEY